MGLRIVRSQSSAGLTILVLAYESFAAARAKQARNGL